MISNCLRAAGRVQIGTKTVWMTLASLAEGAAGLRARPLGDPGHAGTAKIVAPHIDNILSIRHIGTMNTDAKTAIPLIVADIYELAGRLRDDGEAIARTVGQTQARWQVMSAASADPRTVPQIARRLGVSRQNVQRIADLLVAENWASFEPNPDHKGSPYLVLNARGRMPSPRSTKPPDRATRSLRAGSPAPMSARSIAVCG